MNTTVSINHLAIIMDGNGRWATTQSKSRTYGHEQGVKAALTVIDHACAIKIPMLSLFAMSTENTSRPIEEVKAITQLMGRIVRQRGQQLHEKGIRIHFLGDLSFLPKDMFDAIDGLMKKTLDNKGLKLNILLNYSGQWHIEQAFQAMLNDGLSSQNSIVPYLYADELVDIDFLIRTGGELRLSNFMLWHLAYTELYFTETLWPDMKAQDIDEALADFYQRKRRFGLIDSTRLEVDYG